MEWYELRKMAGASSLSDVRVFNSSTIWSKLLKFDNYLSVVDMWNHGIMGRRFPDVGLLRYRK